MLMKTLLLYDSPMKQIHLRFKAKSKKITISRPFSAEDLARLISSTFELRERIVGLTDENGKFYDLNFVVKKLGEFQNKPYFLVTAKDLNEDNMSFASEYYEGVNVKKTLPFASGQKPQKNEEYAQTRPEPNSNTRHFQKELNDGKATEASLQLPTHPTKGCVGIVGDLALFEQFFLGEGAITVVNCYVKAKPPTDTSYPYYLCHAGRNSTIIYSGLNKICEFYVADWARCQQQVEQFVRSFLEEGEAKEEKFEAEEREENEGEGKEKYDRQEKEGREEECQEERKRGKKQDKHNDSRDNDSKEKGENEKYNDESEKEPEHSEKGLSSKSNDEQRENDVKQSFLQNLNRLIEEDAINELQYYKLKSQVLQRPQDFIRKYQMGTRQGFRKEIAEMKAKGLKSRERTSSQGLRPKQGNIGKRQSPDRMRSMNRTKKYEIPIIVRKYNNVIEKISTSYPLSLEQEQAINIILELELKGLISQREAGLYKSLVLQEESDTFRLFTDYFSDQFDQIELANKLKSMHRRNVQRPETETRERIEHDMRLLIKHAKQDSYELLRKLARKNNQHVLEAIESFRGSKDTEAFVTRLQKIAQFYRAKEELDAIE